MAVVSHRSVLKAALAAILGLERRYFWEFYLDNAAYTMVEHRLDIGYTITRLNEGCHLGRGQRSCSRSEDRAPRLRSFGHRNSDIGLRARIS